MSIRLRLTLWYTAVLALTLIAFSMVLYVIQARYTLSTQRRDLALEAQRIAAGVIRIVTLRERSRPWPESAGPQGSGSFPEEERIGLRSRDATRLLDASGAVVDHPLNEVSTALPLSHEGLHTLQQGNLWEETATLDGERWLIHNRPLIVADRVLGVVQVARSLADRDRALRALGATLLSGSLVTLLIAFGIGWLLAGATLRPIQRITQTAQAIGAERDLTRRVQYAGPDDEIGRLTTTFNLMLSQLQEAYQRVAHALDMQRDFVADVSHELRTPLTTIRGNLALLNRVPSVPPDEREDILTDMVEESERLIRLVNDLLTLARADAGRKMNTRPVALRPIIEEVCRQVRMLAPDRAIECAPLTEVAVAADRDALKQVLLALLDNTLKHSDGPVTVAVRVGHQTRIEVVDTGPGMDSVTLANIFERFYRGDTARSTPGFGLGLAIAKALVEAQDGTLEAKSQVGKGSVFSVVLPRADARRPRAGDKQ